MWEASVFSPPFPKDGSKRPLIVYFHGGGMVTGEREDSHGYKLARSTNAVLIFVDYRLAPEHPFPAGPLDCFAVLRYVVDHADSFGIDKRRIAVAGLSAGGLMATTVAALATHGLPDRPPLEHPLAAQIALQPMLRYPAGGYASYLQFASVGGLPHLRMEWFWHMYVGNRTQREACEASYFCDPFRQNQQQIANLPPLLMYTGTADALQDEGDHYADILQDAGVQVYKYKCRGSHIGCTIFDTEVILELHKQARRLLTP